LVLWISQIADYRPRSPQSILKLDQALVFKIGPTEIYPIQALRLALFDELPKEERHSGEMMESVIRAAVLVNHRASMLQGEDGGNGSPSQPYEPDLGIAVHLSHQVPEPGFRLWKKPMTPAGYDKQIIEFVDQFPRSASLVLKVRVLCVPDSPLNTALMSAQKELLEWRLQAESMQPERLTGFKSMTPLWPRRNRP
jgi:hypothetical protein